MITLAQPLPQIPREHKAQIKLHVTAKSAHCASEPLGSWRESDSIPLEQHSRGALLVNRGAGEFTSCRVGTWQRGGCEALLPGPAARAAN